MLLEVLDTLWLLLSTLNVFIIYLLSTYHLNCIKIRVLIRFKYTVKDLERSIVIFYVCVFLNVNKLTSIQIKFY